MKIPKIPGVKHRDAVRALQKAGFRVVRESKDITMSGGTRIFTILRGNPVDAFTLRGIVRDAGLTTEQFKNLLWPATGYETLIYECMKGDATLFKHAATVEKGWEIV